MDFIIFMSFLVSQRLFELFVARRNERWLLQNGAVEYGRKHYPVMILLHTSFLISLIVEYWFSARQPVIPGLLITFILLILAKIYVITTLGKYWNTKIYRIPGSRPVSTGLYKYIKHPNYMIVIGEIAVIPLAFHLYYTAIIFTLLNAAMLYVRISVENKALAS